MTPRHPDTSAYTNNKEGQCNPDAWIAYRNRQHKINYAKTIDIDSRKGWNWKRKTPGWNIQAS
jgi:hypothetical protein